MSDILRLTLAAALTVATSVAAIAAEPIALRDMGSFHVGGRLPRESKWAGPQLRVQFLAFFAAEVPAMRPNTLPMVMPMPAA